MSPISPKNNRKQTIPKTLDCRICTSTKPLYHFPSPHNTRYALAIPPSCRPHLGRNSTLGAVCNQCITSALTAQLSFAGAHRLGCFEKSRPDPVWEADIVARYLAGSLALETWKIQLQRRTSFGHAAWNARSR